MTVFPTCAVEHHDPAIGRALVAVFERNGVGCERGDVRCCGAPALHTGDLDRFRALARRNVAALAGAVRAGRDVVVAQPSCARVVREEYPRHLEGDDARLVAERSHEAGAWLAARVATGGEALDTAFTGEVPRRITYHEACHQRASTTGGVGELLRLTGAEVDVVRRCSGTDGGWGLRAANEEVAVALASELGREVEASGGDVVASDCHLAALAIDERTGRRPRHPLQVLARAYGLDDG